MKCKNNKIVYERGDWVVLDFLRGSPAVKIISINDSHIDYEPWDEDSSGFTFLAKIKRPATQEEINSATKEEKIVVGDCEVEFIRPGMASGGVMSEIKVGCVAVSKETFLKIKEKAGW